MLCSHRHISGAICLSGLLLFGTAFVNAGKVQRNRPITHPGFDPTADRIDLFDAMAEGHVETTVIARNARGGSVLIKNTSNEPLTVELPEAFVAVQINKQFGGGGLGGGMGGAGGMGGGQQSTGGGFGNDGGGAGGGGGGGGFGGAGGGGGQGFFSIPPEKTVRLPYGSVCLNHGKPEPNSRTRMQMVRVESYTTDPVLTELITMVGTGRLNHESAQAAVWTRTDNMSWNDLAGKIVVSAGRKRAYFRPQQLQRAQLLVATATGRVREKTANATESNSTVEVITTVPSRGRSGSFGQ
ncbi:MAG: hypothetical protein MK110_17135 [Fuerstiella sp.]|nr:hypothetical protein [Fuerstiella sp.]